MGHDRSGAAVLIGERRLARSQLADRPERVAPGLVGCVIVVGESAGRIVEVEAYAGVDDPASHAHRGPTPRSAIMFGEVGHLYVYRSYGVHWCANVVAHGDDGPGAVLIRGIEPLAGLEAMRARRPAARRDIDLGAGPGRLTQALGIVGAHSGVDLLDPGGAIQLLARPDGDAPTVEATPRIGISVATGRPWRFAMVGSPHRSRRR